MDFDPKNFPMEGLGDFKAVGGLIAVPPSVHEKGTEYRWIKNDKFDFSQSDLSPKFAMGDMPPWLWGTAKAKAERDHTSSYNDYRVGDGTTSAWGRARLERNLDVLRNAKNGTRNRTLYEVSTKIWSGIKAGHIDEGEIKQVMELAKTIGLADKEIEDTIKSAVRIAEPRGPKSGDGQAGGVKLEFVDILSVKPKAKRWLWKNWIRKGVPSLVAGKPKHGKSTWGLDLAVRVAMNKDMPDGTTGGSGNVIIISMEDQLAEDHRPKVDAAGYDGEGPGKIVFLSRVTENGRNRPFDIIKDCHLIDETIRELGGVAMIVVDPMAKYMGGKDGNKAEVFRAAFEPMERLAKDYDCAVVGIHHLSKSNELQGVEKIAGSVQAVASVRAAIMVEKQRLSEGQFEFKATIGATNTDGEGTTVWFQTERVDTTDENGDEDETVRIVYKNGSEAIQDSQDDHGQGEKVLRLLKETLADGARPSKEIEDSVLAMGIGKRTLDRVKAENTGIKAFQKDRAWYWRWKEIETELALPF